MFKIFCLGLARQRSKLKQAMFLLGVYYSIKPTGLFQKQRIRFLIDKNMIHILNNLFDF